LFKIASAIRHTEAALGLRLNIGRYVVGPAAAAPIRAHAKKNKRRYSPTQGDVTT